jgi:ribulose-5-phosphate 4-epimerase/fuculose-1-phosphate aldolase
MIDRNLKTLNLQTIFVSRENSNCPFISNIARLGKKLKDLEYLDNLNSFIVSIKYGKRMLINNNYTDFDKIKREDFLEIVDYNPIKKILLVIGPGEIIIETPVHWLIHHARKDVNVIFQINNVGLIEKIIKKYPITKQEQPPGTIDQAKEILKTLRTGNTIIIKNKGILFAGNNLKGVESRVLNLYEEFK